jgi:hypothetical protein
LNIENGEILSYYLVILEKTLGYAGFHIEKYDARINNILALILFHEE